MTRFLSAVRPILDNVTVFLLVIIVVVVIVQFSVKCQRKMALKWIPRRCHFFRLVNWFVSGCLCVQHIHICLRACVYVCDCQTRIKCRPNTSDAIQLCSKKSSTLKWYITWRTCEYNESVFFFSSFFKFLFDWWCCRRILVFPEQWMHILWRYTVV